MSSASLDVLRGLPRQSQLPLDAGDADLQCGPGGHQDGGVQDAVLLGADKLLAVDEQHGAVAQVVLQRRSAGRPTAGAPELDELVRIASTLDPEDLRVLLALARQLARPRAGERKSQAGG